MPLVPIPAAAVVAPDYPSHCRPPLAPVFPPIAPIHESAAIQPARSNRILNSSIAAVKRTTEGFIGPISLVDALLRSFKDAFLAAIQPTEAETCRCCAGEEKGHEV
jgi:hypothetical protein